MIGQGFGFAGLYRSEAECNLDEQMVGPNKLGSDMKCLGGSNFFSADCMIKSLSLGALVAKQTDQSM